MASRMWLTSPVALALLGLVCVALISWSNVQVIGLLAASATGPPTGHTAGSEMQCESTTPGKHFLADSRGSVCHWKDTSGGCCTDSPEEARYSCDFCNEEAQCCMVYEYCVSCCLGPDKSPLVTAMMLSASDPILQSASSPFDFCQARCRTSSRSVTDNKEYRSDHKYCYGTQAPVLATSGAEAVAYATPSAHMAPESPVVLRGEMPVVTVEAEPVEEVEELELVGMPKEHTAVEGLAVPEPAFAVAGSQPQFLLSHEAAQLVAHGGQHLGPVHTSEYSGAVHFADSVGVTHEHMGGMGNVRFQWDVAMGGTSPASRILPTSLLSFVFTVVVAMLGRWAL